MLSKDYCVLQGLWTTTAEVRTDWDEYNYSQGKHIRMKVRLYAYKFLANTQYFALNSQETVQGIQVYNIYRTNPFMFVFYFN